MKILMFYNLTLVFVDLFVCLDQEKEGVRHNPQLFLLKDWVDNDFRIIKSFTQWIIGNIPTANKIKLPALSNALFFGFPRSVQLWPC